MCANWVQFEIRIGLLIGTARGEPDEGGDRGADALDRLRLRRDLLDVDAGRQVVVGMSLHSGCGSDGGQLPQQSVRRCFPDQARRVAPRVEHPELAFVPRPQQHGRERGGVPQPLAQVARIRSADAEHDGVRLELPDLLDEVVRVVGAADHLETAVLDDPSHADTGNRTEVGDDCATWG